MRITYKLHITNLITIILIVVIGVYSFKNLNMVLTKLRFIEIADDLNASFLETRINEKNFFLYNDKVVLNDLKTKLNTSIKTMDSLKKPIIRATGRDNFDLLQSSCKNYLIKISSIAPNELVSSEIQSSIRESGQTMRELSHRITSLERKKTNSIIMKSKKGLLSTLCIIVLFATGISYFFLINILKSLKKIKNVAGTISQGIFFHQPETEIPKDEIGSVLKAINRMVTELKDREGQIIQSKKLASIGILTAGVAHELGNPLNNISVIAQTFQEYYSTLTEEKRLNFMKMVEEESDRIKEIVTNLLDFSKPKEEKRQLKDMNQIVKKGLRLVQNLIHISNIELVMELQEELPPVMVNENRILEVLVNLMTNAIHAMTKGGTLTLVTKNDPEHGQVNIKIIDNGKGIPADILQHLFDPFFSTKGTQGTGLGLFVSYGIIKNHSGQISVDSQIDQGTTFTVSLPVTEMIDENIATALS